MKKKVFRISSILIASVFILMAWSSGSDEEVPPTENNEISIPENETCCCCNGKGERQFANNGDSYYGTHTEICACCDGDGKVTLEASNDLKRNSLFCQ